VDKTDLILGLGIAVIFLTLFIYMLWVAHTFITSIKTPLAVEGPVWSLFIMTFILLIMAFIICFFILVLEERQFRAVW